MALAFSRGFDSDLVVYDNMDELSAFRGASPELLSLERELFARADIVFTGGASLYEAKRARHRNVHLFPSSIDFEHFARARRFEGAEPDDQAAVPRPRLGFFGVIDERMDVDLVRDVAALKPDWHLMMIGPVVKIDPAILPRRDNIHWLGGKGYQELPRYLAGWDVGLMPFALNESTRFISPTKTPEYLAAGVPVVSTPITDVVRAYGDRGLVEIARDPAETARKAEALLARPKGAWLAQVDRHLAADSWDKTWAAMHRLMVDAIGRTESASLQVRAPAAPAPAE
jgi:UDP-galactopyranose mutase